jgi:hypothetical protein
MRLVRMVFISLTVLAFAMPASAQYYGSPDPLRVPTTSTANIQPTSIQPVYSQPAYAPASASQPSYAPQVVASRPMPGYVAPNSAYGSSYGTQPAYQNQGSTAPVQTMPSAPMPAPPSAPMVTAAPPAPAIPGMVNGGSTGAAPVSTYAPAPASPSNAAPQGQSVMSQMLNDPGKPVGQGAVAGSSGYVPYGSSVTACSPTCTGADCGCSMGTVTSTSGCCPWYGSLTFLALTRNAPNKLWVSSDTFDESIQLMNTQQCESPWKFGGEIRFGRRFCCGNPCDPCFDPSTYWAVEATYWTVDRFHGYRDQWGEPDPLNTPLRVSDVHFIDPAQSALDWFAGAKQQWLERYNEIHNVELAVLGGRWANAAGSAWDYYWSIGPRFFRFDESLTFGTVKQGADKGPNIDNANIHDQIINTLWGCQLGSELGYNATSNLRFFAAPKVGIYGNHMENNYRIALGDGTAPIDFPAEVDTTKNRVAFLMQIDVGAEYFIARHWSLRGGYRALAATGIGLADNQIPWAVYQALDHEINSNGDLVLHGAFASVTYNF